MLSRLDSWHKTRQGYLTFGAVELLLCYVVASFAINNGSLLFYAAAIVLLYGAVRNFVLSVHENKHVKHAKHRPKKTA